jgi:3-hydroxybutyryl-CoA dehydrogenase
MDAEAIAPGAGGVGVAGAGTMGQGIAYVFAMAGFPVWLVEPDAARAAAARAAIRASAAEGVARGKLTADAADARLAGLTLVSAVADLPAGLPLVVETVPERADLKARVLAAHVPDAGRFLGMHFFNPVAALKLVELVRGAATTDATLARARGYAQAIGKTTVTVRDAPGFATSRLDLVQALEAIRMVEAGVASPADIDRAVTTAYRHPVGPLRLSDMVGLDVRLDIARQLETTLGPHFAPPRLLQNMVARGELGAKSGRGFYDWPAPAAA